MKGEIQIYKKHVIWKIITAGKRYTLRIMTKIFHFERRFWYVQYSISSPSPCIYLWQHWRRHRCEDIFLWNWYKEKCQIKKRISEKNLILSSYNINTFTDIYIRRNSIILYWYFCALQKCINFLEEWKRKEGGGLMFFSSLLTNCAVCLVAFIWKVYKLYGKFSYTCRTNHRSKSKANRHW